MLLIGSCGRFDRAQAPESAQCIDSLEVDAASQQSREYSATFDTLPPPAIEYD
jgi:hypothetical protein